MDKRILHIFDDEKFVDFAIKAFNQINGFVNEYWVTSISGQLKFVNEELCHKVLAYEDLLNQSSTQFKHDYDAVVLHLLNRPKLKFIEKVNYHKFVWKAWGVDYYQQNPELLKNLYLTKTAKYIKKTFLLERAKHLVKKYGSYFYQTDYKLQEKNLHKFKFLSTAIDTDFQIILDSYKNAKHLLYAHFNYASVKSYENNGKTKTGQNILLGNSATPTNNHLDLLHLIKENNALAENQKIVMPLSYGNSIYAEKIESTALSYFQESQVVSMRSYVPLDTYNDVISSCKFMIMGHLRQQGLGNILSAFHNKVTVYLHKDNLLFHSLIDKGFKVKTIDLIADEGFRQLTEKEVEVNCKLVSEIYSEERHLEETKLFLRTIVD